MTATEIGPEDPRYAAALDDVAKSCGMRVEDVLPKDQWDVVEIEGEAQVVVSPNGLRAFAMVSPLATEQTNARAEELLTAIERHFGGAA